MTGRQPTGNKDFFLPEAADYTLRLHREAEEGLGRCQLTLVTTEGAKIADHLLFSSDKSGHEGSRCLGETTEKGQIQGGGGGWPVPCVMWWSRLPSHDEFNGVSTVLTVLHQHRHGILPSRQGA